MNRRSLIAAASIAAIALAGAGRLVAQDTKYDYDRSADFSKYKTYKWVNIEGAQYPDQLTDKNIRIAADEELAKKGLTRKDADPVDVYVAYQIAMDKEKQYNSFGYGGGWRWGGNQQVTTSTLNIGTFMLDFYDPASKSLVWQGTATKTVHPSNDADKNMANLEKGIGKMLKDYPPPPPKK
jgi:hypothetical protein